MTFKVEEYQPTDITNRVSIMGKRREVLENLEPYAIRWKNVRAKMQEILKGNPERVDSGLISLLDEQCIDLAAETDASETKDSVDPVQSILQGSDPVWVDPNEVIDREETLLIHFG